MLTEIMIKTLNIFINIYENINIGVNKYEETSRKLIGSRNGFSITISDGNETFKVSPLYCLIWKECDGKKTIPEIAKKINIEIREKNWFKIKRRKFRKKLLLKF